MDFMRLIHTTLEKYNPGLSSKSRGATASLCSLEESSKNDLLLIEGKPNHQEYLRLDGMVRSFLLNSRGKAITNRNKIKILAAM